MLTGATDDDLEVMSQQLGRRVRDVVGVAARCVCGRPTVVSTAPRLSDGSPFPTFYYLTHPAATAAASRLEAEGVMAELQDSLEDPLVGDAYRAAHEAYLADRAAHGAVHEIATVSAGGMPMRVKCLHALIAHSLAVGAGVNPIGDRALAMSGWSQDVCSCVTRAGDAGDSDAR